MSQSCMGSHSATSAAQMRATTKATSQPSRDSTSYTSPRQAPSSIEASTQASKTQSTVDIRYFCAPVLLCKMYVTASELDHRRRQALALDARRRQDRKSTRLNSSHSQISYAVFCLKKKKN